MQITRGIFQTLAIIILGAIVYVWFFIEESERTIPLLILVSLFVLLSLEYVREGFSQKKSRLSQDIKHDEVNVNTQLSFFSNYARL